MKKHLLIALMTLLSAGSSIAQLTQGEIKFAVGVTSTDASMEMAVSMMAGTTMSISFSGESSRTDMQMGAMMSMTTVVNADTDTVLILLGGMMGNTAIVSTSDQLEEIADLEGQPEMEFELFDETKLVLGYTCKKAVMTDEDGNEVIYWYTKDIKVASTGQQHMHEEIPGFPLEFETSQNGMQMNFVATSFSENLSENEKALFDTTVPNGYTEMSYEDLKSMGLK